MKLPLNCTVEYHRKFLSNEESQQLYDQLISDYELKTLKLEVISAGKKNLFDYGKIMFVNRELYETNKFPEEIWGKIMVWPTSLIRIKQRLEELVNKVFSVCVCIYYPDGNTGVDYHSDYAAFGDTSVIPSISIGEEREFLLREKENLEVFEITLEDGSLLIMGEHCQQRYEHCLPVNPKFKRGRINLTFRQYGFDEG